MGAEQILIALRVCKSLQWLYTALTFMPLFWEVFALERLLWWLPVEHKPAPGVCFSALQSRAASPRPSQGGD